MTDYKSMFEQAVITLAAIDEALGIGDDGCGDPDQTLTAIAELMSKQTKARGRPRLPPGETLVVWALRLTVAQRDKVRQLGGGKWVRTMIDKTSPAAQR